MVVLPVAVLLWYLFTTVLLWAWQLLWVQERKKKNFRNKERGRERERTRVCKDEVQVDTFAVATAILLDGLPKNRHHNRTKQKKIIEQTT